MTEKKRLGSSDAISGAVEYSEVIPFGNGNFVCNWNRFLGEYGIFSFRYSLEIIDYYKMFSKEIVDRSFVVVNTIDGIPLCICPVIICREDEKNTASYGGTVTKFLPCPLFDKRLSRRQRLLVGRTCSAQLEKIFLEHRVTRWYSETTVVDIESMQMEEALPAVIGALDVSIQNHFLRVDVAEGDIKTQIRTRARNEINSGLRCYDFKVYDETNFTDSVGQRHQLLHQKTAGRLTRPIETFLRSYKWISEGKGLMFEQLYNGISVNMTLICFGGKVAYGASTADDPDFDPPAPLMHSMLWAIAIELKRRGFIYYEVGATNHRDSIYQILSPKEKSIIFFKKGFGTDTLPFKRWVWFSTRIEEVKFIEESLKAYKELLLSG